jgi:hypothetical protein
LKQSNFQIEARLDREEFMSGQPPPAVPGSLRVVEPTTRKLLVGFL